MLDRETIQQAVSDCLIKAGTTFRVDQMEAYERAIACETNRNARWALERILENAETATRNGLPLCDDTGIPHAILEVGEHCRLPEGWLRAITDGVVHGLRAMPGRPMAVRGDWVKRVEQSEGLYEDPGKVSLAPVSIYSTQGDKLKVTILLLGGGPEIRAKTYRVFHKRSLERVLTEAANWMISEVRGLGCTPCVPAIGIGRTHFEASALMLEAMKDGTLARQTRWENMVTEMINKEEVGPLGLGGLYTALGTFIKVGDQRASGVRIVSVRPGCCFEPRKSTVIISGDMKRGTSV